REGLSVGQSQRVIWTEPSWWPLWYPRGLRRRGNVWERLPAAVRRVRTWPAAFLALGVLGHSDALFHFLDWGIIPVPLPIRAVAARQLLVSMEHADRELAELARSLDAGEGERLAAKIEALGAASAPIRPLLEKQLELVRELQARIEEGREERNRRVEMLKTLALNLTSLRARATETPGEVPSLSDRVRALCDEIGGQALA